MSVPLVAVLAGGRSRRMGTDKACVEIDERPLIGIVVSVARQIGADVVALGPQETLGGLVDVPVIPDGPDGGTGPVAGLAAVLAMYGRSVVLVATDQPYVRPETLTGLWGVFESGDARAVVPVDSGVRQVTCAVYPASWSGLIGSFASLQDACDSLGASDVDAGVWRQWGEDGRSWQSLDSPAAIESAVEAYGPPP